MTWWLFDFVHLSIHPNRRVTIRIDHLQVLRVADVQAKCRPWQLTWLSTLAASNSGDPPSQSSHHPCSWTFGTCWTTSLSLSLKSLDLRCQWQLVPHLFKTLQLRDSFIRSVGIHTCIWVPSPSFQHFPFVSVFFSFTYSTRGRVRQLPFNDKSYIRY